MTGYFFQRDGVAATEFALITPFIIFILLGMFDVGLYINAQMKLENAARAAAEYVSLSSDIEAIQDNVIAYTDFSEGEQLAKDVTLSAQYQCECTGGIETFCDVGCDGDYMRKFVEVNISMEHETIFPYPGLPSPVQLEGTVRYQVQ